MNPPVGTMGCWIEVNVKDRGWQTMGLINYHVVRPALVDYTAETRSVEVGSGGQTAIRFREGAPVPGSMLWNTDKDGLSSSGTSNRTPMERPSRAKHNFTVHQIRKRMRDLEDARMPVPTQLKSELASITSFFDSGRQCFGRPCFASGYLQRTTDNGRLDWELIRLESDDRVGGNSLPKAQEWSAAGYAMGEFPFALGRTLNSQQQMMRNFKPQDVVFKTGASTKCTVGAYNGLKADCIIAEERYMAGRKEEDLKSTEHVFIGPRDKIFANKGDSGAAVWDRKGCIVGLLFRGLAPHQTGPQAYALVTPIEDVVKSIKDKSKGDILGVRVLGADKVQGERCQKRKYL